MFYVIDRTVSFGEVTKVSYRRKHCSLCGWYAENREPGIVIRIRRASELVPVVWTANRLAFSEWAIRVFRKAGLTGWEVVPEKVKLRHKKLSRKVPTYYEIDVTGKGGSISHNKGVRLEFCCPECGRARYSRPTEGISVDPKQWDGSDIFRVKEMPGHYLVSEAFAEVIRRRRVRGVELVPEGEWRDAFAWMIEDSTPKPGPEKPEYTFDIVEELRRRKAAKNSGE